MRGDLLYGGVSWKSGVTDVTWSMQHSSRWKVWSSSGAPVRVVPTTTSRVCECGVCVCAHVCVCV